MFYGGDIMKPQEKELIILCCVVMVMCLVTIATNIVHVQRLKNTLKTQNDKEISKIIICEEQTIEAEINSQIKHLNKFQLLLSIMYVESRYNFKAIGDNGSSFGFFQVKEIFYLHHTKKEDFEAYKFDEFKQIDLHLNLLKKYENLTILEFAQKIQRPFNAKNWADKVCEKYNSYN